MIELGAKPDAGVWAAGPAVCDGRRRPFEVADERKLSWSDIRAAVDAEQQRLRELIARVESSGPPRPGGFAETTYDRQEAAV
jgi:hypothetical protein